jgi:uncharacterized membrane protein
VCLSLSPPLRCTLGGVMAIVTRHYNYSERGVGRRGRTDGRPWSWRFWPFSKRPKPAYPESVRQGHAPFEVQLTESAEAAIGLVVTEWENEDVGLKTAYASAITRQRHARDSVGKESAESNAAAEALDEIRAKYLAFEMPTMGEPAALALLVVFGASEAVFNGMVFQIFGERLLFTWALAAGIGVVFPFLGHAVGGLLKLTTKRRMDWVQIGGALVLAVAALVGVSTLRGVFLEGGHVRELLGLTMTAGTARAIFFVFNLALFFAAVLVGYLSGHVDAPLFNTVRKRYRHALARYQKESAEANAAVRELAQADHEVAVTRNRRGKRFLVAQKTAVFIKEKNDWLISVYREANQRARAGTGEAVCFTLPILVAKVPQVILGTLEWALDEGAPIPAAASADEAARP